jgi:hypothetical protein
MPTTAGTQYTATPVAPARQPIPAASPIVPVQTASVTTPIATPTPPTAVVVPQTPPTVTVASNDRWKEPATVPTAGLTNLTPPERPVAAPVGPPNAGWIKDVPALPASVTTTATTTTTTTSNAIKLPSGPIQVVMP